MNIAERFASLLAVRSISQTAPSSPACNKETTPMLYRPVTRIRFTIGLNEVCNPTRMSWVVIIRISPMKKPMNANPATYQCKSLCSDCTALLFTPAVGVSSHQVVMTCKIHSANWYIASANAFNPLWATASPAPSTMLPKWQAGSMRPHCSASASPAMGSLEGRVVGRVGDVCVFGRAVLQYQLPVPCALIPDEMEPETHVRLHRLWLYPVVDSGGLIARLDHLISAEDRVSGGCKALLGVEDFAGTRGV